MGGVVPFFLYLLDSSDSGRGYGWL